MALIAVHRHFLHRQRRFRRRIDFLDHNAHGDGFAFDDGELVQRFRFPRRLIEDMTNEYVAAGYGVATLRSHAISNSMQVQIGLRFMATGAMHRDLADVFGVSQSSVQRIVHRFTEHIANQYDAYVAMPATGQQMAHNAHQFHALSGFPRIIGSLDGTHIKIKRPYGDEERAYVNRHHDHSLNVQVVADTDRFIRDLVVRWPGGTHDATVWTNSYLKERFSNNEFGNYCLVGDSAYPCEPWLMTPLPEGGYLDGAELRYQRALVRARHVVECALGVLKSRMRVLDDSSGLLDESVESVATIIKAAVVLNNRALRENIPAPIWQPEARVPQRDPAFPDVRDGLRCRQHLIDNFFN